MSLFSTLPEDFLQFVWKTLNFDLKNLSTTEDTPVQIINPGVHNLDQGPDFLHASIQLGRLIWHGHIEIHIQSEAWYRHQHHLDPQYNGTILHVVLDQGKRPATRQDGTLIPEVVLKGRIPQDVLQKYQQLRLSDNTIPCEPLLERISTFHRQSWLGRLTIERMEEKAERLYQTFLNKDADWEEALWQGLASYMGGPTNQEAFLSLAQKIPYRVIRKYSHEQQSLEALLFGGVGCLGSNHQGDNYSQELASRWHFFRHKHSLSEQPILLKFGRMRPASFPTIRLAQLASLLHQFTPLISLLEPEGIAQILARDIPVSAYWRNHYRFFVDSSTKKKRLGQSQKEVLVANVLIPLSFLYHRAHGRESLHELIESGLEQLSSEHNRFTRPLEALGFHNEHGFHSQGLIQLHKHYCKERKCLSCHIGQRILRP